LSDKPSTRKDGLTAKDKTGKLVTRRDGQLLSTEELAAYLGDVSVRTLEDWRRLGLGPDFVPLSPRLVRYRPEAVNAWLLDLERKSRAMAAA
jgi:Helix-turn-helix domain